MKKILYTLIILCSLLLLPGVTSAKDIAGSDLRGKILLQVEENGEAWYIYPSTGERYYMGRPQDAFQLLREKGIGISDFDLEKIEIAEDSLNIGNDIDKDGLCDEIEKTLGQNPGSIDSSNNGKSDKEDLLNGYKPNGQKLQIDENFAISQKGRILLQVEQNGEAWYVNPDDNKRYFLYRPKTAFEVMKKLGLGINNDNLNKITMSESSKELLNKVRIESAKNKYIYNMSGYYIDPKDLIIHGFKDIGCFYEVDKTLQGSRSTDYITKDAQLILRPDYIVMNDAIGGDIDSAKEQLLAYLDITRPKFLTNIYGYKSGGALRLYDFQEYDCYYKTDITSAESGAGIYIWIAKGLNMIFTNATDLVEVKEEKTEQQNYKEAMKEVEKLFDSYVVPIKNEAWISYTSMQRDMYMAYVIIDSVHYIVYITKDLKYAFTEKSGEQYSGKLTKELSESEFETEFRKWMIGSYKFKNKNTNIISIHKKEKYYEITVDIADESQISYYAPFDSYLFFTKIQNIDEYIENN